MSETTTTEAPRFARPIEGDFLGTFDGGEHGACDLYFHDGTDEARERTVARYSGDVGDYVAAFVGRASIAELREAELRARERGLTP